MIWKPVGFIIRLVTGHDVRVLHESRVFQPVMGRIDAVAGLKSDTWVSLAEYPAILILSVLFHEDDTFFRHHGIHWSEVKRRGVLFITGRGRIAGGSSISQQLVRFIFLGSESRQLRRKFKEVLLTFDLERNFSKEQILEIYLSVIRLGYPDMYGFSSAAERYFGRHIREITLEEGVFLSQSIDNPTRKLRALLRQGKDFEFDFRHAYEKIFDIFLYLYCEIGPEAVTSVSKLRPAEIAESLRKFTGRKKWHVDPSVYNALSVRALRSVLLIKDIIRELPENAARILGTPDTKESPAR